MPTKRENIVLFTDPGGDDITCMLHMFRRHKSGEICIKAIVGHYGCTTRDNSLSHIYSLLEIAHLDIPVLIGSEDSPNPHPGTRETHYDPDGACGVLPILSSDGVDRDGLYQHLASDLTTCLEKEDFTMVVLGAATDPLHFMCGAEDFCKLLLKRAIIMAGTEGPGNVGNKSCAEFNVFMDVPGHVALVSKLNELGITPEMVPWHSDHLVITEHTIKAAPPPKDRVGETFINLCRAYLKAHPGVGWPNPAWQDQPSGAASWVITDPKVSLHMEYGDRVTRKLKKQYRVVMNPDDVLYGAFVREVPRDSIIDDRKFYCDAVELYRFDSDMFNLSKELRVNWVQFRNPTMAVLRLFEDLGLPIGSDPKSFLQP